MRTEFHAELENLNDELAEMCSAAGVIMAQATTALVHVDIEAAEHVITDLERLDRVATRVGDGTFAMLALQAPVAGDLRQVFSAIQIAADANRMGGLAANVAKVARRHHPEPAVPASALSHFVAMGEVAVELADRVGAALIAGDAVRARQICTDDSVMDGLHRELFTLVTDPQWSYGASSAADVVLIGRFYGRFADHAVEIARRIIFRTTGAVRVASN
jgi:phosphate transport system protein